MYSPDLPIRFLSLHIVPAVAGCLSHEPKCRVCSFGMIKRTAESFSRVESSVYLIYHNLSDHAWNKKLKVIGSCRFLSQCFLPSGLCHVTENRTVTNIFLCLLLTVHITGKTYLLIVQCPGKTYSVTVEILRCCHILVSGDLEYFPYVSFFQYIKWIHSQRWSWSTSSRSSAWNE